MPFPVFFSQDNLFDLLVGRFLPEFQFVEPENIVGNIQLHLNDLSLFIANKLDGSNSMGNKRIGKWVFYFTRCKSCAIFLARGLAPMSMLDMTATT